MGGPGAHEDLPESPASPELKVGSKLWQFDCNRRIYQKDAKGRSFGGPIWREHWRPAEGVGETRVSWIINTPGGGLWDSVRVPKKDFRGGKCPRGFLLSEEAIDREAWVHDNASRLGHAVMRCGDYDTLKKIAEMVGYKDQEPST